MRKLSAPDEYTIRRSMTASFSFRLFAGGDAPQPETDYRDFPFAAGRFRASPASRGESQICARAAPTIDLPFLTLRLVTGDGLSARVADVQNNNRVAFDSEQNAVNVRLAPIKELAHFEGELRILRSQWAAQRKFGKRGCRFI
jgi:hypothetical protein